MVQERIEAGACVRLIKKWLKAGVLETDGTVLHPASGTPPRGYRLAPYTVATFFFRDRYHSDTGRSETRH
jgi:hypothetical protein